MEIRESYKEEGFVKLSVAEVVSYEAIENTHPSELLDRYMQSSLSQAIGKHLIDHIKELPIDYSTADAPEMYGVKHELSLFIIDPVRLNNLLRMEEKYMKMGHEVIEECVMRQLRVNDIL